MKKQITSVLAVMSIAFTAVSQCLPGATDQTFFQTNLTGNNNSVTALEPFGDNVLVGSNPGSTNPIRPQLVVMSPTLVNNQSSFDANPQFSINFQSGSMLSASACASHPGLTTTGNYSMSSTGQVDDIIVEANTGGVFNGEIFVSGEQSLQYTVPVIGGLIQSPCNINRKYKVATVIKICPNGNGTPDLSFVVDWDGAGYSFAGTHSTPKVTGITQNPLTGNLYVACSEFSNGSNIISARIIEIDSDNGCVLNVFPLLVLGNSGNTRMEFDNLVSPTRLYVCSSSANQITYNSIHPIGVIKENLLVLDITNGGLAEFDCNWLRTAFGNSPNHSVRDIHVDPADPSGQTIICAGWFGSVLFTGTSPAVVANNLCRLTIPANGNITGFFDYGQSVTINNNLLQSWQWSINDIVVDGCDNIIFAGYESNSANAILRRCGPTGISDIGFGQNKPNGDQFREILLVDERIWIGGGFTYTVGQITGQDLFIACNTLATSPTQFSYCKQIGSNDYQILFSPIPNPANPTTTWSLSNNGVLISQAPSADGAFQTYMNSQNFLFTDLVEITRTIDVGSGNCTAYCGYNEVFNPSQQCNVPSPVNGVSRSHRIPHSVINDKPNEIALSKSLLIYPNPTKDTFIIQPDDIQSSPTALMIFDQTGRLIVQSHINKFNDLSGESIDVKSLSPGSYLIVVQQENKTWKAHFVKD